MTIDIPPFEDLTLEIADRIATLSIDRPPANALRTRTYEELRAALLHLYVDDEIRVLIVRSANPRFFCAGADWGELPMPADVDMARQDLAHEVFSLLQHFRFPTIASLSGWVLGGGCALAASCDIRVATPTVQFGLPEINVGRAGGGRHLMRLLPQGAVRRACLTGQPISALDAHRLGLIDELTDDVEALPTVTWQLAREIADKDSLALRLAKQSLDLVEDMSVLDGYRIEQQFTLRLGLMRQIERPEQ